MCPKIFPNKKHVVLALIAVGFAAIIIYTSSRKYANIVVYWHM